MAFVHAIVFVLGVWLMAAPAVLGFGGGAEMSHRIVGPLIATFGWVAMGQCTRGIRKANFVLAAWLIAAPLIIDHTSAATISSIVTAFAVAGLSLIHGEVDHGKFGGGWSTIFRPNASPTSAGADGND
ncbi:MAG: hypothetical protein VYC34_11165 [Planctomycetota bacterium]|nr:hypothetical protein [Planctomycetota bacterium]